jgi:hypothetical protein
MTVSYPFDKMHFNMPDEFYGLSAEMHNHQNRITSEFCIDPKDTLTTAYEKPVA